MELDIKQEMKTATATVAEMAEIWWFAFKKVGLPPEMAQAMIQDWFRVAILPSIAPDPLSDMKDIMKKMFPQEDE